MSDSESKTPLEAAVASAKEFKALLDMQPADQLFWPVKGGKLLESACYAQACLLLQQAVAQDQQIANRVSFERSVTLSVARVVANHGADVPANPLQLFAGITAAIAQLAFEVLDESGGGTKHSGLLEIGVRFCGQVDQVGELVEGKRDAVHESVSDVVVEQPLCHGAKTLSEVG